MSAFLPLTQICDLPDPLLFTVTLPSRMCVILTVLLHELPVLKLLTPDPHVSG